MKIQHRNIATPCCKDRVRLAFKRGTPEGDWLCHKGGSLYRVTFFRTPSGRSGKVSSKTVIIPRDKYPHCSCGALATHICDCGTFCCGEDPCEKGCGGSVRPLEQQKVSQ
ncbi:hypothetical protein MUP79_05500 [Candidatus Bathyarchaeota archaeon]|nr:hypothetical protein [Candidatus Bathyarchaeota archaeon]